MSYQTFTTNNNRFPSEGPRALAAILQFGGAEIQSIDLMLEVQQKKISLVQGLFFNNVDGPDLDIVVDDTQQAISIPAGKQGTLQLLTTQVPKFTITSRGSGVVRFHFVNFPILTTTF